KRFAITSAAKEAAEKRLKQVNSTFCATTIQQLTSDFWVKKRPKLLLWFIFQQPLKPCPFKACCLSLPKQMNNPGEAPLSTRTRPNYTNSETAGDRYFPVPIVFHCHSIASPKWRITNCASCPPG